MRMRSVLTTIGAHQSVGSVTGVIIPWSTRRPISVLSFSRYAKGMVRGVVTQKGRTSSVKEMWNCSPGMVYTCPLNMDGNSAMIWSTVGIVLQSVWVLHTCPAGFG